MVDEYKFDNKTYAKLREVYEDLPSYMGNEISFPCWFGDKESGDKYFITVSFETSGLQFWGELPFSDFLQWENKLNELIGEFPF